MLKGAYDSGKVGGTISNIAMSMIMYTGATYLSGGTALAGIVPYLYQAGNVSLSVGNAGGEANHYALVNGATEEEANQYTASIVRNNMVSQVFSAIVSRGVASQGGEILGIAPSWISSKEPLSPDCTDFIYTETMDERKNLFLKHSDCVIVAPGGLGTLDEFFEILTLKALGQYENKIILFNVNKFYSPFKQDLAHFSEEGFIKTDIMNLFRSMEFYFFFISFFF